MSSEKKYSILLVDDRPENLYALEKTLGEDKYNLVKALSGEEALKIVLKQEFSLILLDVQMPGMDGYEVAQLLSSSKKTKDIPIIFVTAINKEKKHMLKGFQSGAVDYIPKPVDPDVLLSKVNIFLKLHEQQKETEKAKSALEDVNTHLETKVQSRTKELEASKLLAEKSLQIKEEFLANMSHEIRTPVNAILGFSRLLLDTTLTADQREEMEAILFSSEQLLSIINDILDFSKIEAGKVELEETDLDLHSLLNSLIKMQEPKANEKGIKVLSEIQKEIPQVVIGDPVRLNQIFSNLLNNAIKFTETGEVKLKANLINLQSQTLQLQFEVSDTGIGIPEHKLDKVWDSFSQASSDTTRKFGGTGLGLTIVKRLVGLHHGGKVGLKSTLGQGTTFTVNLNLQTSAKSAKEIEKSKVLENDGTLEGIKILLAEDNRLNQVVATKVLAKMGIEAEIANNGIEALEMAQSGDFAMVLMDIQMPDMDGYEATRRIRKLEGEKGQIPIVALTADVAPSVTKRCMEVGMNDYLPKPFQEKELFQKMKRWANVAAPVVTEVVEPIAEASTNRIINMATLQDMADGNTEFIDEMINMFLEDTPDCLAKIEVALTEGDHDTIQRISHKMKPSMGFMGMPKLEATIAEMERKAEGKEDITEIKDLFQSVNAKCEQAFLELKQELKRA